MRAHICTSLFRHGRDPRSVRMRLQQGFGAVDAAGPYDAAHSDAVPTADAQTDAAEYVELIIRVDGPGAALVTTDDGLTCTITLDATQTARVVVGELALLWARFFPDAGNIRSATTSSTG